jgi:hypothetical protein
MTYWSTLRMKKNMKNTSVCIVEASVPLIIRQVKQVRVLNEASCFLRTHHLEGRYICESKYGSRCIELECVYECRRHSEFSWIS